MPFFDEARPGVSVMIPWSGARGGGRQRRRAASVVGRYNQGLVQDSGMVGGAAPIPPPSGGLAGGRCAWLGPLAWSTFKGAKKEDQKKSTFSLQSMVKYTNEVD